MSAPARSAPSTLSPLGNRRSLVTDVPRIGARIALVVGVRLANCMGRVIGGVRRSALVVMSGDRVNMRDGAGILGVATVGASGWDRLAF